METRLHPNVSWFFINVFSLKKTQLPGKQVAVDLSVNFTPKTSNLVAFQKIVRSSVFQVCE